MANTRYGVTGPEKLTTNGGIDAAGVLTCNIVETLTLEQRKGRVATLRQGIGTLTTDEITGGVLREVSWADRGDGYSEVTATYKSSGSESGDESGPNPSDPDEVVPGDRYTISMGLSAEPLLTHPKFDSLTDEEVLALKLLQSGDVDAYEERLALLPAPTENYELAETLIARGEESYFAPTLNYSIAGTTNNLDLGFNDFGKIATPPGFPGGFGDGQTFLYAGANANGLGDGQMEFEKNYLGSGRGGWNTQLYGAVGG